MPRAQSTVVPSAVPIRTSPRKRKYIDEAPIEVATTRNGVKPTVPSSAQEGVDKSLKRVNRDAKSGDGIFSQQVDLEPSQDQVKAGKDQSLSPPRGKEKVNAKDAVRATAIKVKKEPKTKDLPVEEQNRNAEAESVSVQVDVDEPKKAVRKRKTKEEKAAEAMPLAARTAGLKMFVGAHVSIAKGLENAVTNSVRIGGNAFALFLKSQRKWDNPGLRDENREAFKQHCSHHEYDQSSHVVPHGSYLVNLASPDTEMSRKSYEAFVDDLRRCEALGIKYYNFHPGSTNKEPLDEAIGRLAGNLNRALAETTTVTPLLENMAGHGSIIGSRFSDLRDIIAAIKPEYKSRIGICIDTCHAFAAGYDLRSPEAFKNTFRELDETVGLQYLKAMHINDSKAPFNSHRDLHQNIGAGFLGLRAFHNVMNDERLQNVPLILETPCDRPDPKDPKKTIDDKNVWAREIKLLESLTGMDVASAEFTSLEADLSEQGRAEREKMEASIATREEKARKKADRALIKGQKNISTMFGGKGAKRKGSVSSDSSLSEMDSNA